MRFVLEIIGDIPYTCIHSALNIGYVGEVFAIRNSLKFKVCVFVVNKVAFVARTDVLRHCAVIDSAAALVAETPHNDAAVVFVALVEKRGAVNVGVFPIGRI